MLSELKREKLRVEMWSEKSETAAAIYRFVNDTLFQSLPYPAYSENEITNKTVLLFDHLKTQYSGKQLGAFSS